MSGSRVVMGVVALLCGALVGDVSFADRDHWRRDRPSRSHQSHFSIGLGFGAPLFSPWYYAPPPNYYYYYPPTYYPPPLVSVPAQPPVYIEQGVSQAGSSPGSNYWYYCHDPKGYYPYVEQCPAGWQRVSPVPPPPAGN